MGHRGVMKKLPLLAAAAAGYVLGTRAGRERYEQIRSGARKVAGNPKIQAVSSRAQEAVKDTVTSTASTAADKVRGRDSQIGMQATP
jgi:hypothetical protein